MSFRIFELSGTTDPNIDSTSELELQLESGIDLAYLEIVRVFTRHLSGSATTFQVSIGNTSGFASYSIDEKYLSDPTSIADVLDEANMGAYCGSSPDGKLYVKFYPDAGADNQFEYFIMYKI